MKVSKAIRPVMGRWADTCSVLLGCGAAWLVDRTTLPGAGIWRALLLMPLAIPAFVSSCE